MFYSLNERGKKTRSDDEKFWGGGGGRKGVKFHFEVFGDFRNRKMRGIS